MKIPFTTYPLPERTLLFWLSTLAFIALVTSAIAVYMHGLAGFFVILALAFLAGFLENSLTRSLFYFSRGISENKLLALFAVWYQVCIIINSISGGKGLNDWRFMLSPMLFIIGLWYTFAFLQYDSGYRYFQIALILGMGIQSVFTTRELINLPGIARIMWTELGGTWLYGNQAYFALSAILFPILLWRSFKETGILRPLLLVLSLFLLIAAYISSFGTPVGLMIVAVYFVVTLLIVLPVTKISRVKSLLVAGLIASIAVLVYTISYRTPLLEEASTRIDEILRDPVSGGYTLSMGGVSRWYLAEESLQSFKDYPLFGMGGGNIRYSPYVGAHSSFFDALGAYGLLGGGGALTGIIVIMLVQATLRFLHERSWEALLALTTVVLLVVAGIVNPYWEGWVPLYVLLSTRPVRIGHRNHNNVPTLFHSTSHEQQSTHIL